MMRPNFQQALTTGSARVSAWADLLDRINVFPVADGDTGRNLSATLVPFRVEKCSINKLVKSIFIAARGNSGNIAARFFSGFLQEMEKTHDGDIYKRLPIAAEKGTTLAQQAVANPRPGTMLTFFEALAEASRTALSTENPDPVQYLLSVLADTVRKTRTQLPQLIQAGVVDAGALGMYLFFEAFLKAVFLTSLEFAPVNQTFAGLLEVQGLDMVEQKMEYCFDVILVQSGSTYTPRLSRLGNSVVSMTHDDLVKLHLHTDNLEQAKRELSQTGKIVSLAVDDLQQQEAEFRRMRKQPVLHIITDAAGSVTRVDASRWGFTLLDSYIFVGERCFAETQLEPSTLYQVMRDGVKVSTSQASDFERRQLYERVMTLNSQALYLCVGSAYTGNFETARRWQRECDPDNQMHIIDTGAASGQLGLIALATARYSVQASQPESVLHFAKNMVKQCQEYLFLERLHYLARGGRLSKGKAFFGDLLNLKPVVTPTPQGAEKVAVTRNREEQVEFALARLEEASEKRLSLIMLQYTDNGDWVETVVLPIIAKRFPEVEIRLQPLSLTTGAHTGPGTWAVAFCW